MKKYYVIDIEEKEAIEFFESLEDAEYAVEEYERQAALFGESGEFEIREY